jgi:PAS domain S-box-containing protein
LKIGSFPAEPSAVARYGFALASSAVAAAITSSYPPLFVIPFALNFVAVTVSAWYGGYLSGIVATVCSALLVDFFVLPPRYTFVPSKASLVQVCTVSLVSLFICLIARQREPNEEGLRSSERKFRGLVEGIHEGFGSFDLDWKFTYINAQGAAMTGHVPEQLIGQNAWEPFPEIVRKKFETAMNAALVEQKVIRAREYYPPLNKWFELAAYPASEGVCVLFQDITEKVEAEEGLRTADRLAIAGRLAATVSHEVNNPLEAIGNLLYLAEMESSLEKSREYISEAGKQLYRASQITKQTLNFDLAWSEAKEVQVSGVVREAIGVFSARLANRDIQLQQEIDETVCIVIAPGELTQVMANLIANAADASPRGGRVVVEVRREPDSAMIRVSDEGPGVAPDIVHKIFDAFFTTKRGHGTGLGLWICKNTVQRHGGSIWVENHPEHKGATFVLRFPLPEHLQQQRPSPGADDPTVSIS